MPGGIAMPPPTPGMEGSVPLAAPAAPERGILPAPRIDERPGIAPRPPSMPANPPAPGPAIGKPHGPALASILSICPSTKLLTMPFTRSLAMNASGPMAWEGRERDDFPSKQSDGKNGGGRPYRPGNRPPFQRNRQGQI